MRWPVGPVAPNTTTFGASLSPGRCTVIAAPSCGLAIAFRVSLTAPSSCGGATEFGADGLDSVGKARIGEFRRQVLRLCPVEVAPFDGARPGDDQPFAVAGGFDGV